MTTERTFAVHFTDPSAWARVGGRQLQHWKLVGPGEIVVESGRVLLRGRRHRPFWTSAKTEIALSSGDLTNVIREGSVVQCHVRGEIYPKVLRVWLVDESTAEALVQALPRERTAQFEKLVAEQSSFNTELAALGTRSVVVPVLVVLNCAVFAATVFAGAGIFDVDGRVLVEWGTDYGPRTLNGEWWRLLTSTFVHFGLLHLALNMWALWGVGQLTEKLYGSAYFLVLYLFAGLAGSLASLYWHPEVNSAGASGAIFGVLGGLFAFVLNPKTRVPASIAATHRNSSLLFIFYNLVNGFAHAGIDNAAHIGGLVGGFAIGWLLARPVAVDARHDPLQRLSLVAVVGVVFLIALAWPLFHPNATVAAERKFRQQFELFAEAEATAVAAERELRSVESAGAGAAPDYLNRVATSVIPKWEAAEATIVAAPLPADSHLAPLREALLEYLAQKRRVLTMFSEAVRDGDAAKAERAKQVADENNARAAKIQALIRRVY